MTLPPAPVDTVGADGAPRSGRYAGLAEAFNWHLLGGDLRRGALWRRLHHKRWHFVSITTEELYCAAAVVDIGWGTSSFGYIFERARGCDIAGFSQLGMPGMSVRVGANARTPSRFGWSGGHVEILPAGPDQWVLSVRGGGMRVEASFGEAVPHLLAIGAAAGGSVHATQKSPALPVVGFAEANGRRFRLDEGVATFDYSNGLLGRATEWRWLAAHAPDVGVNLQQGYFGSAENALWLDGQVIALGEAELGQEPGGDAWRVRTGDGLVDLRFSAEGIRRDDKQLLLASSKLTQQIGVFDGWVKAAPGAEPRAVRRVAGLIEHHRARW
jgi:hypothetical protein